VRNGRVKFISVQPWRATRIGPAPTYVRTCVRVRAYWRQADLQVLIKSARAPIAARLNVARGLAAEIRSARADNVINSASEPAEKASLRRAEPYIVRCLLAGVLDDRARINERRSSNHARGISRGSLSIVSAPFFLSSPRLILPRVFPTGGIGDSRVRLCIRATRNNSINSRALAASRFATRLAGARCRRNDARSRAERRDAHGFRSRSSIGGEVPRLISPARIFPSRDVT